MITAEFDPKDLLEFHIMMENLDPEKVLAALDKVDIEVNGKLRR